MVNGYSNNTRLKTFDPNWATLGYQPKDNAEDHRERLRAEALMSMRPTATSGNGPSTAARSLRLPEKPVR